MAKVTYTKSTKTPSGITKTVSRGSTWSIVKLPVYVLLTWLLILGPIFAVQTTFENGRVVLAEQFTFQQTPESTITVLNNYDLLFYTDTIWRPDNGSEFTSVGDHRTQKVEIINNSVIIQDFSNIEWINFYNGSTFIGWFGQPNGPTFSPYIDDFDNFYVPNGATHFAIVAVQNNAFWTISVSFSEFQNNESFYETTITQSAIDRDYYQIMENARTAEYGNIFSAFEFLLNIPSIISNSQPLAFVGNNNTFSQLWDTITNITSLPSLLPNLPMFGGRP